MVPAFKGLGYGMLLVYSEMMIITSNIMVLFWNAVVYKKTMATYSKVKLMSVIRFVTK